METVYGMRQVGIDRMTFDLFHAEKIDRSWGSDANHADAVSAKLGITVGTVRARIRRHAKRYDVRDAFDTLAIGESVEHAYAPMGTGIVTVVKVDTLEGRRVACAEIAFPDGSRAYGVVSCLRRIDVDAQSVAGRYVVSDADGSEVFGSDDVTVALSVADAIPGSRIADAESDAVIASYDAPARDAESVATALADGTRVLTSSGSYGIVVNAHKSTHPGFATVAIDAADGSVGRGGCVTLRVAQLSVVLAEKPAGSDTVTWFAGGPVSDAETSATVPGSDATGSAPADGSDALSVARVAPAYVVPESAVDASREVTGRIAVDVPAFAAPDRVSVGEGSLRMIGMHIRAESAYGVDACRGATHQDFECLCEIGTIYRATGPGNVVYVAQYPHLGGSDAADSYKCVVFDMHHTSGGPHAWCDVYAPAEYPDAIALAVSLSAGASLREMS